WGVPTFTTARIPLEPELLRSLNVDWICPHAQTYDLGRAEACREAGLQVWTYTCCGPRFPYTNIMADDPLICARIIGWQMYQQKLDGFLFWGLNYWARPHNDRPIHLPQGPRLQWSITTGGDTWYALHGDGVLLYPLPDGPMGSIRLANIRDGFEDYEYLWALGEAGGDVDRVRHLCEPVTTSLSSFTLDPELLLRQRESVAQRGAWRGPGHDQP
ncbi:MAG: glycoside hydrolase domain-containing protein, partial [Armatimonadota bacterium]